MAVSILSSTLTPGVHPTFPLRFVSYGAVFPMPETAAPNADVVVDLISSYVGSRKPGELAWPGSARRYPDLIDFRNLVMGEEESLEGEGGHRTGRR
jgi:hypothetical protein